jgi:hypothetical protein
MGASFPFDRLTTGSVEVTLPRYERVEFCPTHTKVTRARDKATVPADDAGQGAVLLDAGAAAWRSDTTELGVIRGAEFVDQNVLHSNTVRTGSSD